MGDQSVFSANNLPSNPATWPTYRKTALSRMVRIDGPFTVETREGVISCPDGYLAVDSQGFPYPIAADEQVAIYEPAGDDS